MGPVAVLILIDNRRVHKFCCLWIAATKGSIPAIGRAITASWDRSTTVIHLRLSAESRVVYRGGEFRLTSTCFRQSRPGKTLDGCYGRQSRLAGRWDFAGTQEHPVPNSRQWNQVEVELKLDHPAETERKKLSKNHTAVMGFEQSLRRGRAI
jgi:hypothetical protein